MACTDYHRYACFWRVVNSSARVSCSAVHIYFVLDFRIHRTKLAIQRQSFMQKSEIINYSSFMLSELIPKQELSEIWWDACIF